MSRVLVRSGLTNSSSVGDFAVAMPSPARPVAHRVDPAYIAASEGPIKTLQLETTIGPDGVLRIEAPTHMAPGPAQVVVVVSPVGTTSPAGAPPRSILNIPPHRSGAMHGDWTRDSLLDEMIER